MTDTVAADVRSRIMAKVKGRDTSTEMIVRRLLHGMGYRYRLHAAKLPGKPDVVFPSRKAAIFVHGCFWHSHESCARSRRPQSNADYWTAKLNRNMERDKRNILNLESDGWRVLVIWECETRRDDLGARLVEFLSK